MWSSSIPGVLIFFSVNNTVRRLGYQPTVSYDAKIILQANKLLLPGIGTAQAMMKQLHQRELINLLKACTQPMLGICLGFDRW